MARNLQTKLVDQFSEPDNGLASRCAALRALGTAVLASGALACACQAAAAHPDAGLLRLGAEFDRLHAAWLPVDAECKRLEGPIAANFDAWRRLKDETGLEAALDAEERAFNLVGAVTAKIRRAPAKTFAGLAVKARALRFDAHLSTQCDLPPEDQDWPEQVMNEFVADIDRLAAGER